jgi:hypothetical protein
MFFAIVEVVGGLVIGLAAGTDLSPILLGLLGGLTFFAVAIILNFIWGEYWFDE